MLVSSYQGCLYPHTFRTGLKNPHMCLLVSLPNISRPIHSHYQQVWRRFSIFLTVFRSNANALLLDGFTQLATDSKIWKAFRSHRRLHLATDAGLSAQKGTHGWIISTGQTSVFQCSDPVDGPSDTSSSTRSELAGYASALLLVRALASKSAISIVQLYALSRSILTRMPPDDADLLLLILSHCSFRSHWVMGHQDSTYMGCSLPLSSRLNFIADNLATLYRKTGQLKLPQTSLHEVDQKCSISVNSTRLTSQYNSSIRFHINGYHLRQYLQCKPQWTNKVWGELISTLLVATSVDFVHTAKPRG